MDMKYEDNQPIIDLFNGKPLSIIKLLNEESKLQSSSVRQLRHSLFSPLSPGAGPPAIRVPCDASLPIPVLWVLGVLTGA